MQALTQVEQLFGAFNYLRDKPQAWHDSSVGKAVKVTCGHALRAYIDGHDRRWFCFSADDETLRTSQTMDEIRGQLGELFGAENISIRPDDSYYLGVRIEVAF